VYPNPTSGNLRIDLGEESNGCSINIYNVLGQLILHQTHKSTSEINLNINGIPGLYILEVQTEEGKIGRMQVIKE